MDYPMYTKTIIAQDQRYYHTVEFIAMNDEPCESDVDEIANMISTVCASVAFDWPADRIAQDVYEMRKRNGLI